MKQLKMVTMIKKNLKRCIKNRKKEEMLTEEMLAEEMKHSEASQIGFDSHSCLSQ
jgi:hypothetical protein